MPALYRRGRSVWPEHTVPVEENEENGKAYIRTQMLNPEHFSSLVSVVAPDRNHDAIHRTLLMRMFNTNIVLRHLSAFHYCNSRSTTRVSSLLYGGWLHTNTIQSPFFLTVSLLQLSEGVLLDFRYIWLCVKYHPTPTILLFPAASCRAQSYG